MVSGSFEYSLRMLQKSAIVTETLLESRARDPEPSALNSVIEMFFAADVKQRIARRTGFSIVW